MNSFLNAILVIICALLPDERALGVIQESSSSIDSGTASVVERHWTLTEVDGISVAEQAENQPYIYLQQPGDRLSGSGGCNRLLGTFDLSKSTLQFHSVAATRMACVGDSGKYEPALLDALKLTTSFRVTGDTLELTLDNRTLARFRANSKK